MRIEGLPGIDIQDRDWKLLQGLFHSRVMTLKHIAALHFDGMKPMAKKRVQKLKSAGLIRKRPRHSISEPSVLFVTLKAFAILRDSGKLSDYPRIGPTDFEKRAQVSVRTIRHELAVMDVKAAMVTAINATEKFRVAEFSTWPRLYEFRACLPNGISKPVQPDGCIRIHETEADGGIFEHAFFLEVDLGGEGQNTLIEKCHCYRDFFRTGGYAVRCGGTPDESNEYSFRVLVVCRSKERGENLAKRLLETYPPFLTMILITTQTECVREPLGDIWITPAAYREMARRSDGIDDRHAAIHAPLFDS